MTWRQSIQKVRKWCLVVKVLRENMRDVLFSDVFNQAIFAHTSPTLPHTHTPHTHAYVPWDVRSSGVFVKTFGSRQMNASKSSNGAFYWLASWNKSFYPVVMNAENINKAVCHQHTRLRDILTVEYSVHSLTESMPWNILVTATHQWKL